MTATAAEIAFRDGILAQVARDATMAERCYRDALASEPDYRPALYHLALILDGAARHSEAAAVASAGVAAHPDAGELWQILGQALHHLGRDPEAAEALGRAVAIAPANRDSKNLLGTVLLALERPAEALAHFDAVLAASKGEPEALGNRAAALLALDRAEEALAACRAVLPDQPENVGVLRNLGAACLALDRDEAALQWFAAAARLSPDDPGIAHSTGMALARLGRLDEAAAAFDAAIRLNPRAPRHYRARGLIGLPPEQRQALEALDGLSEPERIERHFALGKEYDALGRAPDAMAHWLAGNAAKRRRVVYDEAATLGWLDRIRETFTPELLAWGGGDPSPRPVFIVGMPRSGSTLVEQILASHPAIAGAGELRDFGNAAAAIAQYPEGVAGLDETALAAIGTRYDRRLAAHAPAAARVADKMLSNYRHLGLIRLVLPNARIIHIRRDPVDTCLACFGELFAEGNPHTYALDELGRYYAAYRRLMAHWRAVLPPGIMLEIDYETLVADTAAEARRLVAHLGVDWDDRCLDFHQTQRPVRTLSLVQVRRPVYGTSVGRARRYMPYLAPLVEALEA